MFGQIVLTIWHCFTNTFGEGFREDVTCELDPGNQRLLGPSPVLGMQVSPTIPTVMLT